MIKPKRKKKRKKASCIGGPRVEKGERERDEVAEEETVRGDRESPSV